MTRLDNWSYDYIYLQEPTLWKINFLYEQEQNTTVNMSLQVQALVCASAQRSEILTMTKLSRRLEEIEKVCRFMNAARLDYSRHVHKRD